ncbi:MAG: hypothetical protein Terrestrivirus2_82 [Terrestrivirus sp.]|uniref:Histidine phosphatase family protein n=1 Tax=Terrestrivirus sp. TaxID=2487775 RepID=A0A3G4ZMD4_9VIRU|nr:MAG: hypothetical protein Terrestrivirus2_82 [Terrestrivirus sp.]
MKFVLFRHSIREHMVENNCSISREGVDMVNTKLDELKNIMEQSPEIILTSPYKRAFDTSLCIASYYNKQSNSMQNIQIMIDIDLRETVFREMQTEHLDRTLFEYLNLQEFDTWETIMERCKSYLKKIKPYANSYNVVFGVSHGGFLNAIVKVIDPSYNFDTDNIDPHSYVPKYADFVIFNYDKINDKWVVEYKNF